MTASAKRAKGVRALKALLLVATLALGLLPGLFAPEKAHAASGTVTLVGWEDSITEYGWTQRTRYMELNGQLAICCQHFSDTPPVGTPATVIEADVSNDLMRKVAWYGWGGPGSLSELSLVQTACAMSNANNEDLTLTGRDALAAVADLPSPPSSFVLTKWSTGGVTQDLVTWTYQPYGGIELDKASGNASVTDGNACYSLAGAEYGVYRDEACTDLWFSMTTDEGGHWETAMDIPVGDYWVKEIAPPKGYALDETVYPVSVSSDSWASLSVNDLPQGDPVGALLRKRDGELSDGPQGAASLALAQFTFWYYDGYYDTLEEARASGDPTATWVMQTDEDGYVSLRMGDSTFETDDGAEHPYKVSGSDFYYSASGGIMVPYGTVFAQETRAPEGYRDNPEVFRAQVAPDGSTGDTVHVYNTPVVPDGVIRGGVEMPKLDRETQQPSALGGASVDGAEFTITSLNDNPVIVGGVTYGKGDDVLTIITRDGEPARSGADALPYGDYLLRESKAPEGYLPTDETWRFSVRDDGVVVKPATTGEMIDNQVKRGDFEFVKIEDFSQERMAGVPFLVTSATTGEAHVIVTDQNGYVSTEAAWNAHTSSTNANDEAVSETAGSYVVDESKLDGEAGVWFGLAEDGSTTRADDELGALPYDTYTVQELPCSANEGHVLVSFDISITRNGTTVQGGTVTDDFDHRIDVLKVDAGTGDPLAGAALKLVRLGDGKVIDEWTSDDSAHVVKDVEPGLYELVETAAPDGYFVCQSVRFTVYEAQPVTEVLMSNDYTKIDISKTDLTGEAEVEGAHLVVRDADGNVVDEWISGAQPHRIERLEPGDYTLEETIPPATYDQAEPVKFTVPKSGEVVRVQMVDKPIEISGDLDKRQTIAGEGESYDYTIDYRSTSNTYADELNLTDPLEAVSDGFARVASFETPVAVGDWDGKLNVWYQTNMNDKEDATDAEAHNACDTNPHNANNPDNERMTSYIGWVYLGTFDTGESSRIDVEDLGLSEGEYLTAIRIEHGRVEEGFTTNTAEETWDREGRYDLHDDIEAAEGYAHNADSAPLVLHMQIVSDAYFDGRAELRNSADMDIWRNKGAVPEKLYDEDHDEVIQEIVTKVEISKKDIATSEELPGAKLAVSDKETGALVEEWTSSDAAHRISALVPGDYVLTEVSAPEGYEMAEALEFTVEPVGAVQHCTMYDVPSSDKETTKKSYFDKTGDWLLSNWPVVAGIALMGVAATAAGIRLAKKKG